MAGDQSHRPPGDELLIAVGWLSKPHGVLGEIKLKPHFDFGLIANLAGKTLYYIVEGRRAPVVIQSARPAGKGALVSLAGVSTPEQAAAFSNRALLASRALLPDPPGGGFYYEEVVGLPVYDPQGELLGRLAGFFEAGGADVWVIASPDGEEILTPCIPETLISVDLKLGKIVMKLMESE